MMPRSRPPLLALAAALTLGCTEVSTDPSLIVALQFDALPFPAVVAFDTLRDESGVARRLAGQALNGAGTPIVDAPVRYVATAEGLTISDEGYVIAGAVRATPVPIVAQVGGLQSRPLSLPVVPRPDTMSQDGSVDTLRYVVPDNASNASGPLRVRVQSRTVTPPANVSGWLVRYTVEYRGTAVPEDDPDIWLVDDSDRRSRVDTTGADGIASRRVRVRSTALAAVEDSVVVFAEVRAYGTPLAGGPLRFVVPIIPR
jgi:hypothetical protein